MFSGVLGAPHSPLRIFIRTREYKGSAGLKNPVLKVKRRLVMYYTFSSIPLLCHFYKLWKIGAGYEETGYLLL